MSEFSTNGHRAGGSTSGTYNKNGGLKAVTPPQYAYGNGGYPHANPNGNQVVPSVSLDIEDIWTLQSFLNKAKVKHVYTHVSLIS